MNLRDRPLPQKPILINKTISDMTIKEFRLVPFRESWSCEIKDIDNIIILPSNIDEKLHDSGFILLDFVACRDNKPVCRCSGCSDVIHLNGIGGYGFWYDDKIPTTTPVISWNIDCLPGSGLLRLWCNYKLRIGFALSSFEIFIDKKR